MTIEEAKTVKLPCRVEYTNYGGHSKRTVELKKIEGETATIRIGHAAYYLDYDKKVPLSHIELISEHECEIDSFNRHCQICGKNYG